MPWVLYPGNLLKGNIICLLSSGFIHFEWSHFLLNMLGIFIFANVVERHLGARKNNSDIFQLFDHFDVMRNHYLYFRLRK